MKKHLSLIIISAMIASLLYGCGGGSSAGTANDAPAAETAETQQASEEQEAEASPAEASSAGTGEENGAPTGFKAVGYTSYRSDGSLRIKCVNDPLYGDYLVFIQYYPSEGCYTVNLVEKEIDGDGKWSGSTIYSVSDVKEVDPDNLDVYKTEENITGTDRCTYSDEGLVVERYDSSGNVTVVNTYNNQNQLLLSQSFNQGEESNRVEYTYDEHGFMSRTIVGHSDSEEKIYTDYIPIGAVSFMVRTGFEGAEHADEETELHYDENGTLTGATNYQYYGQGTEPSYTIEYTFELDEYGNLIRDTAKTEDGETAVREWDILPIYE